MHRGYISYQYRKLIVTVILLFIITSTLLFIMGECYTDIEVHTFEYKWTIKRFSTFLKRAELENDFTLKSSTFTTTNDDDIKWHLKMVLFGKQHKHKNFIGLYIECSNLDKYKTITASQIYFLVNSNNERIKVRDAGIHKFTLSEADWGFHNFYKTEQLLEKKELCLPNDELTIICQIDVMGDVTKHIANPHGPRTSENYFSDVNRKLYVNDEFKDVTFSFCDKTILAHKAILAIHSRVFAAMFRHDMEEQKKNIVNIDDVDFEIFEALLRYIYTNELPTIDNVVIELLSAADKYELEALKESCGDLLEKNMTVENAAEVLIIADRHSAEKLLKFTQNFIYEHASDVMATSGYEIMEEEHPKLIAKLCRVFAMKHQKDE